MPKVINRVGKEFNDFCIVVGEPEIGPEAWIGYFCLIDGSGGLKIGRRVTVSSGVHIYTHDAIRAAVLNLAKDHERYAHVDRGPVSIGDNVFIGANSVILPNTQIGDHCVVAALSLVKGDFPPYSFIAGIPATIKGDVRVLIRKRASKPSSDQTDA